MGKFHLTDLLIKQHEAVITNGRGWHDNVEFEIFYSDISVEKQQGNNKKSEKELLEMHSNERTDGSAQNADPPVFENEDTNFCCPF